MKNKWLNAIRIHTLPVGLSPVLMGNLFAFEQTNSINYYFFIATILIVLLLQSATNLTNDYFDGKDGIDDNRIGHKRAYASGEIAPEHIKSVFCTLYLLAFAIGLFVSYHTNIYVLSVGLISIFIAYAYTGGPYPLSRYALGEITAFIFFGPIAFLTPYYLQTNLINQEALLLSAIPGIYAAIIMAINNLRDIKSDQKTSKITLAILLKERPFRYFTIFLLTLLIGLLLSLATTKVSILILLIPIILFYKIWTSILFAPIDEKFNKLLELTGKCLSLTALLFCLHVLLL